MSDHFQAEPFDVRLPSLSLRHPLLPTWLARRLLRPGEQITLVRGPKRNPYWERYVTHPALVLVALAVGAVWYTAAQYFPNGDGDLPVRAIAFFAAAGLVLATIFVVGIACGHFTRLVVTDRRLVILQGQEVCRSWGLNELPASLVRYGPSGPEGRKRTVDLDALQSMLGGSSEHVTEAKTILAFGKHLDRIKARDEKRPPTETK
jgi:hypothetical protein